MEVQPNPYLLQLREKQLIVEEELPNEEKQILEEESKLVESSEDSVNSIFWGATDAQPEVYAASDVSQETIELQLNGLIKLLNFGETTDLSKYGLSGKVKTKS